MIKLLIFDLDNTLFDTHKQLRVIVYEKMIHNMQQAGLTPEQEKVIREKYSFTSFIILARKLHLSEKIKNAGIETYKAIDLSGITPYDDVKLLKKFQQKKILVTSGLKEIQLKKVKILEIGSLFEEVICDESSSPENKQRIFADLMKKYELNPKEILVVGDNADSEIAAGNNLGMITVQILRMPEALKGKADYHVKDLYEVKEILEKIK